MDNLVPQKEIEVYKGQLESAEKYSTTLEIKDENGYQAATIEAHKIKEQLEIIVARKEVITKPLNAALKSVRDLFKPLEAIGEQSLKNIKVKMIAFTDAKERKAEADKLKLDAKVEKGTIRESTAEVKKFIIDSSLSKTVSTSSGSATTKKVAKYYITDKSQIPLDFLEPDMVKIKASFKSGFPVPGVEMRMESELSLN